MLKKILIFIVFCTTSLAFCQTPSPTSSSQEQTQQASPALPTQEIPPLPSSTQLTQSYEGSFIRVIVSLLGLIILVVLTFWILKRLGRARFGKFGSDKSIHIIERRPLSPKSVLFLVQIGNKRVLVSESQLEVRSLASYELVEEVAEEK
jgi:flagellar biogenesis protein FliO